MIESKLLEGKSAKRVCKAQDKAQSHRAFEAGVVKSACDVSARIVKLLADASAEADAGLQHEIKILIVALMRFRNKAHRHVQAKTGALTQAAKDVEKVERLLARADGPGYGVVEVARRAEADFNRVKALRASLSLRAREMAFVLAELEQIVDPLPGMRIASAAERHRNDKLRAKKDADGPEAKPEVVPQPTLETSPPS